jgi:HEAT repeat protein
MNPRHEHLEPSDQHEAVLPIAPALNEAVNGKEVTDTEHLEEIGAQLSRSVRRRRTFALVLSFGFPVFFLTLAKFGFFEWKSNWDAMLPDIMGFRGEQFFGVILAVLLTILPICFIVTASRKQRKVIDKLAANADIQSIGPLIDALELPDSYSRRSTKEALIRVLPQLRASDAGLLSAAQYARLRNFLNTPLDSPLHKNIRQLMAPPNDSSVELQLAILKSFEQIGDQEALPIVERLANREAKTDAQKRLKQAAVECLPWLRQRIELNETSKSLLRPASVEVEGSALLRPASFSDDTPREMLLRATNDIASEC